MTNTTTHSPAWGAQALAAIEERLALTYRLCCGTAPKQSVGELLDVALKMPEWATVRAAIGQPAATAGAQIDPNRAEFETLFATIHPAAPIIAARLFERVVDDSRYCSLEVEYAWRTYYALARAGQQAGEEAGKPTDLSKRLRNWEINSVATIVASDLHAAADEIERYYGGMLNWKRTAEDKDAEIADLRAQLASAQQNADRYLWLRDQDPCQQLGRLTPYAVQGQTGRYLDGQELDSAIDAARAQLTNPTGK